MVGVGLLGWAILATLRARRFGTGTLTLDTLPGVIGGRFAATVETGRPLPTDTSVAARLVCVRRTTSGTGKSRSTHETVLWEDELQVGAGHLQPGMRGTRIPLVYPIPHGCVATDDRVPSQTVHWRVELRAELPGADYVSSFEVPVFRTAASSPELDEAAVARHRREAPVGDDDRLARAKIRIERLPGGGVEFYLPPARNPGMAAMATVFAVGFGTAAVWMYTEKSTVLLPIVFAGFALLLGYGAVSLWLFARRVRVEAGALSVRGGLFALGPPHRVALDDIQGFDLAIGMQSGDRVFYRVTARTKRGRSLRCATGLPGKRVAEHFLATLEACR